MNCRAPLLFFRPAAAVALLLACILLLGAARPTHAYHTAPASFSHAHNYGRALDYGDPARRANWARRMEHGRRAVHTRQLPLARNVYTHAATCAAFGAPELGPLRSEAFLRLALLEQRAGNYTGARDAFKAAAHEGCRLGSSRSSALSSSALSSRAQSACAPRPRSSFGFIGDPRLFVSWGLFEHKHGFGTRVAVALFLRAVAVDGPAGSCAKILRWKQFAANTETEKRCGGGEEEEEEEAAICGTKGLLSW